MEGNIASGKTTCLEFFSNTADVEVWQSQPQWDKLCRAQITPSNRRMLPAASAVHTCELVFKKPHGMEQKELISETPQILVCQ